MTGQQVGAYRCFDGKGRNRRWKSVRYATNFSSFYVKTADLLADRIGIKFSAGMFRDAALVAVPPRSVKFH